ncbi:hypothetical protein ACFQ0M_02960 [Kitasatospora aburaviensis]
MTPRAASSSVACKGSQCRPRRTAPRTARTGHRDDRAHRPAGQPPPARWLPRGQLLAALLADPGSALAERLLAATDPGVRRFTLDATAHRVRLRELAILAETDRDRSVRTHAAEAAARQAVWTHQIDLLHRLARSRHPEVRAAGLTGLMRTGSPQDGLPFLDDSSSLLRALARDAARRTGVDALAHYRTAVRETKPPSARSTDSPRPAPAPTAPCSPACWTTPPRRSASTRSAPCAASARYPWPEPRTCCGTTRPRWSGKSPPRFSPTPSTCPSTCSGTCSPTPPARAAPRRLPAAGPPRPRHRPARRAPAHR